MPALRIAGGQDILPGLFCRQQFIDKIALRRGRCRQAGEFEATVGSSRRHSVAGGEDTVAVEIEEYLDAADAAFAVVAKAVAIGIRKFNAVDGDRGANAKFFEPAFFRGGRPELYIKRNEGVARGNAGQAADLRYGDVKDIIVPTAARIIVAQDKRLVGGLVEVKALDEIAIERGCRTVGVDICRRRLLGRKEKLDFIQRDCPLCGIRLVHVETNFIIFDAVDDHNGNLR